ncbi:MAG TPA: SDR family oxidoreductase [Methylomirabilota bacterium]|nr:SDR family oxidoreductase [Methylomirabilota bacterium]
MTAALYDCAETCDLRYRRDPVRWRKRPRQQRRRDPAQAVPRIRANCVSLALVQTDSLEAHAGGIDDARMKKILAQYPLRRVGRPDDVTPMILLLASPLSGWTTGQVVSVNGGYAMV